MTTVFFGCRLSEVARQWAVPAQLYHSLTMKGEVQVHACIAVARLVRLKQCLPLIDALFIRRVPGYDESKSI